MAPGQLTFRARWPALPIALVLFVQAPMATANASIPEAAQKAYDRGLSERDGGRFPAAAREFAAAYSQIPEDQRELRAAVLFDLVDAHRRAFGGGGARRGAEHPAAHLCAADRALADFIEAEQERRRGKKNPDVARASRLREEVRQEFMAAKATESDLDCAALELPRVVNGPAEPSQEPPQEIQKKPTSGKPLLIAGGVTAGVGVVMLGVMVGGLARGQRAESGGAELVLANPMLAPDDPQLQAFDRRGRSGNAMAIAGGVIGSLALAAGIALLVVGARSGRTAPVAVVPLLTPQGAAAAVSWRF